MRAFLLTTALLVTTAIGSAQAQQAADFNWELGLNGGVNSNTVPGGNSKLYDGTKGTWNAAGSFKVAYNINENWQIGGELGAQKWVTTGMWPINDANGQTLESRKVTFVIANPAMSICAQANHMTPTYSEYKHYNKTNLYYGITLGILPTLNDGQVSHSKYNQAPNPSYVYTSQYDYGYGMGFTAGVQIGYSYYFIPRFGVNIEAAGRYAMVGTSDVNYDHINERYHTFYFPVTVGIRYRMD